MSRIYLLVLIAALALIGFRIGAQADETTTTTTVEKHVIITPAPKSASCTTVAAHWEGDVWVDTQTVCTYTDRTEGTSWVQDYWSCTTYTPEGNCSAWVYNPGHWVKTSP